LLWPFVGRLVYFSHFGILHKGKSGNPSSFHQVPPFKKTFFHLLRLLNFFRFPLAEKSVPNPKKSVSQNFSSHFLFVAGMENNVYFFFAPLFDNSSLLSSG
jgi:hypothetical protein